MPMAWRRLLAAMWIQTAAAAAPAQGLPVAPVAAPQQVAAPGAVVVAAAAAYTPEAAPDAVTERIEVTGSRRARDYRATQGRSATKTDTPLVDTPQAIVVVPRAVIEDQGARDLFDVARNVSGVSRKASYWGQNTGTFSVRGFDLDEGNGYLRDGFRYFARGKVFLGNVDSVEILKGPASVLYGRVEPGGLANLVSAEPSARPQAEWVASLGRWEQAALSGYWSGPVDEAGRLRYRVDASWEDGRSFRDWVRDRAVVLAPQLQWRPDADTKLRAYAEFIHQRTLADYGIPAWQGRPADVPIHWNYGEPFNQQDTTQWRGMLSLERRLSEAWKLRLGLSASRYAYADDYQEVYGGWTGDYGPDGSGESDGVARLYRYWGAQAPRHTRAYAQAELLGRFETAGLSHQLLAGVELGRQIDGTPRGSWGVYQSLEIFNPQPTRVFVRPSVVEDWTYESSDRLRGLYLQDEIELGQDWRLLLGARHDSYVQRYDYVSQPTYDVHITTRDAKVSPRAGLLWKLTPEWSLYASTSRSFAPASAWYAADQNKRFKPLTGQQQELGAKWASEDGRYSASLAAYDLRKRNIVTQDPENPQFSIQLGEERSQGVELDLAAQPWPGLELMASMSHMKARISQGDDSGWFPAGNALPFAPRRSGSLWASWRLPVPVLDLPGRWTVGAGVFAQGARMADLTNSVRLPGYARWDASLGWSHGAWDVSLALDNLTNRLYWDSGAGGDAVLYPGTPRQATLTVRLRQ